MSASTRVTVLVPNYNGAAFLHQCLESIRRQEFTGWQAVVGDNASQDESPAIVASLADPRIRLVRRPRTIGWVANVNLLLAEAGTDYIAVLHADDWWEPGFLATLVGMLDRAPQSLIATCAVRRHSPEGKTDVTGLHRYWAVQRGSTCPAVEAARLLTRGSFIYAPGVLARRELYERLGGYDESFAHACDWVMWVRAACAADVEISPEPLANYRFHQDSLNGQLARSSLWGLDLVRMARLFGAEWTQGSEPFPGAARQLAATVTVDLLADAARRADAGDARGAVAQVRLARAVAPTVGSWALTVLGAAHVYGTASPLLRPLGRSITRLGRRAWRRLHPVSPPPGVVGET